MRLKKSKNAAEEELISLINNGYQILEWIRADYKEKKQSGQFDEKADYQKYVDSVNEWGDKVITALNSIFPTEMEASLFVNPSQQFRTVRGGAPGEYEVGSLCVRLTDLLHGLDKIISDNLFRYTDLPIQSRLYIEDIDSFHKVRDVNAAVVAQMLKDGRVELSEDVVQLGLEQILDVSFHKKDWGGETNDLYTANIVLNGARIATAFLLKGNGLKKRIMEIGDCGKNGDQLVRLFDSPAQLFIIQFVGEISEAVIKDAEGKVTAMRSQGKSSCFCIINGQDTARLLHAYGKI